MNEKEILVPLVIKEQNFKRL